MLEPVLVGALFGAGILLGVVGTRQRLRAWQNAVESCGLQDVESSAWKPRLTARTGSIKVRIEACGNKGRYTRIVAVIPGPPDFHNIRIRPESFLSFGLTPEIEIGDPSFDSSFFIEGPAQLVCALLDAETRRLLTSIHADSRRLEVANGELRAERSRNDISPVLPLLLDLARRLAQPLDVPQRLAENARRDPEAGVRLQNLFLLVHEFPEDPATAEALRAACSDPSPAIRLRAARKLGAEGLSVLVELAESLEDDASSAQAISVLGSKLPYERTIAILDRALQRRLLHSAHACLVALGRCGLAAVDTLANVMARETGELAVSAALALGETGSAAAEQPLILALQREQVNLSVAAAQALARLGSAAAVLPLQEAAERFPRNSELLSATRQAIAEIQSRIQGASPGQLSLAATEAGQLSLADAEAGRLSLATDEGGQLSLPDSEDGVTD